MVKLLKSEWKRYRVFSIIMLIVTAGIALLLALFLFLITTMKDMDNKTEVAMMGNLVLVCLLLVIMPYAAGVYSILSYAADIGRKGMIFLTPVSVWKIILSKLIFTAAMFISLYLVSAGGILLSSMIAETNDFFPLGEDKNMIVSALTAFLKGFVSIIHMSVLIMASISLARFTASSVGIQVLLSIVFYFILAIIESIVIVLIAMIMTKGGYLESIMMIGSIENILTVVVSTISSAVLYVVCVCLTDRKVNLVS